MAWVVLGVPMVRGGMAGSGGKIVKSGATLGATVATIRRRLLSANEHAHKHLGGMGDLPDWKGTPKVVGGW